MLHSPAVGREPRPDFGNNSEKFADWFNIAETQILPAVTAPRDK